MDVLDLLLYVLDTEAKFLRGAREAHDLGTAIRESGLVDREMLTRRARELDGRAEVDLDNLRLLRHPNPVGRACVAVARVLLAIAAALRR